MAAITLFLANSVVNAWQRLTETAQPAATTGGTGDGWNGARPDCWPEKP